MPSSSNSIIILRLIALGLVAPSWRSNPATAVMAFAPPSLVQSTPLRVRSQPGGRHSEPTVTTEPLFLMEVAIGNTSQRQQQQQQQQQSSSSAATLTTQHLSKFSTPLAATSAALHASLLSLLGSTSSMDNLSKWWMASLPSPTAIATAATTATTTTSSSDCVTASKVFQELSHVTLDLFTMTGIAQGARLASVAGRLFSLTADYLPDHFVAPEEWFFQLLMLYWAFNGLFQTASHAVVSHYLFHQQQGAAATLGSREDRNQDAFHTWFEPKGMSWDQYRAMMVFAGEWITLEPGQSLSSSSANGEEAEDQAAAYFLYDGTVVATHGGDKQDILDSSLSSNANIPILGAMTVLQRLDTARDSKNSDHGIGSFLDPSRWFEQLCQSSTSNDDAPEECTLLPLDGDDTGVPEDTWTATYNGPVTLLRIRAPATLNLIRDYDETLEAPLRGILWEGLEAKMVSAWKHRQH